MIDGVRSGTSQLAQVRDYWNAHIHDLEMTSHPVGSPEFFRDLEAYRFDKLRYLPQVVDFSGFRNQTLLEVGCGIGTDLVRFAEGGARVTGVDLAETAIRLAQANVRSHGVETRADLAVANGEALPFADEAFDVVYAHGVLQYTADPDRMIDECHRVLKPGGRAIFMVYNRYSWLNGLSALTGVALEHQDAPVLRLYSIREYREMLQPFDGARVVPERFPVESRLHTGWKGKLYNRLFVQLFRLVPRWTVRPLGWHLMGFCRK